nr:hypothetical protein GCM10025730_52890 [Promicromonospora thailandica]
MAKAAKGSTKTSKKSKKSRKAAAHDPGALWDVPPAEALRWARGTDLSAVDAASTPGWSGRRRDAEALLAARAPELADLQERLFAHGRTGGDRSVLLVLQGLDTSGKGGIVRHVVGMVDPQGVMHRSFGVPTPEERSTATCGASATPCPGRATSVCSTARTTSRCWWSAWTVWSPSRRGARTSAS